MDPSSCRQPDIYVAIGRPRPNGHQRMTAPESAVSVDLASTNVHAPHNVHAQPLARSVKQGYNIQRKLATLEVGDMERTRHESGQHVDTARTQQTWARWGHTPVINITITHIATNPPRQQTQTQIEGGQTSTQAPQQTGATGHRGRP